jgi:hypothetical protein
MQEAEPLQLVLGFLLGAAAYDDLRFERACGGVALSAGAADVCVHATVAQLPLAAFGLAAMMLGAGAAAYLVISHAAALATGRAALSETAGVK